ncbi:MAG: macro domain-containing protein [Lachnospiraceae bacterium]|nr:macro domain-containing protein [Lachnospiraceae bacterium]
MKLRFLKGDITDIRTDAIVLPANKHLKEGSGASEAIFKAAGRKELTKACAKIGFCEIGSAVPTLGYGLKSKYIVHAVVPKWVDGNHNEYDFLSSAYLSALELADVMDCKSIAFPLLASGNNGFDLELAFEIGVRCERYCISVCG